MANYYLQELAEGMGDGKKKLYPKMQSYTLHDYETVLKHMQTYAGGISEGTMRAVLEALANTMTGWMPAGHKIKIDGLGVFSLSLGFDTTTPSERANEKSGKEPKTKYRHICIKGINFKPDAGLLEEMNREASFERVERKKRKKSRFTSEERLAIARKLIAKNGYMTLSDFAVATGLGRTGASLELKRLTDDHASGIGTRGSGSHKVWVAQTKEEQ